MELCILMETNEILLEKKRKAFPLRMILGLIFSLFEH